MTSYDAVVIGSGPNGLSAAITLAEKGAKVLILEAMPTIGGGTRTVDLFGRGTLHDQCSAVHPMGVLSPFFRTRNFEQHGLTWIRPQSSVAHPLDNQPAVLLHRDIRQTAEDLGADAKSWERTLTPLVRHGHALLADALAPLGIPKKPLPFVRFGMRAVLPAQVFANNWFKEERAKALFAGCVGHSIVPFDFLFSASFGLMFAVTGHLEDWPVAKGGSANITAAMAQYFYALGGTIETGVMVKSFSDLPPAKVYLFDTNPHQLADIAQQELPESYKKRLRRFNYGPAIFKVDWLLSEPIPWNDRRCLQASTVHVGGTLAEIAESERATWDGKIHEKPYIILCQQSQIDNSRMANGLHTGWAYCHVPHGSTQDMTAAIENQVERFAKGFKDCIVARKTTDSAAFQAYNPNFVGGTIAGGATDITQLFTRPVSLFRPYATPNPRIFICSASTPPGGGVHGMCGYNAAQLAFQTIEKSR